ncbi:MAG TPA: hypothetical protein DCZ94_13865 [Lentisphaeria bacterium]|nr:MAG: hypothetical protein A2X48_15620 [Lentisphaerae bacterium GWF2_49_21]HBC88033.1 hypothetical protein [Lentisphaeria bacterium]
MLYFFPLVPVWLVCVIVIVSIIAIILSLRSGSGHLLSSGRKRMLIVLRSASFLCLIIMILSPVLNKMEENKKTANIVFLVDSSLSMGCADEKGGKTRYEAAVNFLKDRKFAKIAEYPVSFYSFNDVAVKKDGTAELEKMKASGGTNFATAVKQVDKDIGLSETAAIVFVSDGSDYSGFRGGDIQVPVYCVRTGTDLGGSKDLGIDSFKCPDKARVNEEVELRVPITMHGFGKDRPMELGISEDGVIKEQRRLKLNEGTLTETVKHVFKTEGVHVLKLQVDKLPGEITYLNNSREIAFEVVKDDSETVVYFPELSNSYRPMIRFLEQSQEKFTAVYKVADGKYSLRGIDPDQAFKNGLPSSPDKMSHVGTFILGSHNRPALTDAEENLLEKYVSAGGSLILLGGKEAFGVLPESSPVRRLSPFVHADDSFISGNFKVSVNDTESDSFSDRIREIIARNANDPEFVLKSVNSVKLVKSSAKVILWADSQGGRLPLVAVQHFGKGVVIGVLSNSFPLWGNTSSRTENFNDFWKQLLNYSQSGNESDILKISVNKTELVPGDSLEVNAIVSIPEDKDTGIKVNADLYNTATRAVYLSLPMERRGGFYKCTFNSIKPGRYMLKVSCAGKDKILRQRFKLILSGESIRESQDVRSEMSRFLEYSTAKHIYSTDERSRLESDIYESMSKNKVEREERLVFETPWFFMVLLTLLVAEWILRRKFNLT